MKKTFFFILALYSLLPLAAQDLPAPAANLQTLPAGTYVIAMDNTLQANASGLFNLKAYGLVVYLLNNNVKIKWAIRAGKAKDGIDFTASAEQVKPALAAGATQHFKGGPFVIEAPDTTGVAALVNAYYSASALTGNNRPRMYRITAAVIADIRYNLSGFKPKAAILNDGGNPGIHTTYMVAAGIPAINYSISNGADLTVNCYTFASEPHNGNSGAAVDAAISSIRYFVQQGGNFLAQCEGIINYENNPLGRFQTTTGITLANAAVGTTLSFPYPDLSFSQFEGAFDAGYGGSVKNWRVAVSGANNQHNHATGTGTNANVIGASVSKMKSGQGGLVFYLGSHAHKDDDLTGTNGLRMYMNAFLTPPALYDCNAMFTLALKLVYFKGTVKNGKTLLQWKTANNENAARFELESSMDGRVFTTSGTVFPSTRYGTDLYNFTTVAPEGGKVFFRIRTTDRQGNIQYSGTLSLSDEENGRAGSIRLIAGRETGGLVFQYRSAYPARTIIRLYDAAGILRYSRQLHCKEGTHQLEIDQRYLTGKGSYLLEVLNDKNERHTVKAINL